MQRNWKGDWLHEQKRSYNLSLSKMSYYRLKEEMNLLKAILGDKYSMIGHERKGVKKVELAAYQISALNKYLARTLELFHK